MFKVLAVFGATGVQGGSVIKSILNDPKTASGYKIRAITRDSSKPAAKELADKGCDVVSADLNSKESIIKALKGANEVFAVTNFWEKGEAEVELQQGKNIADACKENGVEHLVWSTLLNVTELSGGKYSKVEHFDSKANVEVYIREQNIPASFFVPGFYMSNFPGGMMRQSSPDSPWVITLPVPGNAQFPLFDAADDTGKFVKAILTKREKTLGKRVLGATKYYTLDEMAAICQKVKPEGLKGAKVNSVTAEQFTGAMKDTGMSEKVAEEFTQNMLFIPEFGYYGKESLEWSIGLLDEKPTTWDEFVTKAPVWKELK